MRIINLSNILPQKQPTLRGWLIRSKLRSQSEKTSQHQSTSKTSQTPTMMDQEHTRKKLGKALQVAILPGGIDPCDPPQPFFC